MIMQIHTHAFKMEFKGPTISLAHKDLDLPKLLPTASI